MLHCASVCCEKMKFVTRLVVQVLLSAFSLVLTWDYGTGAFLGWHFRPCDASPGPSSSLLLHGRSPVTGSVWLLVQFSWGNVSPSDSRWSFTITLWMSSEMLGMRWHERDSISVSHFGIFFLLLGNIEFHCVSGNGLWLFKKYSRLEHKSRCLYW